MRLILDARTATDHFPGIGRYVVNLACAMAPLLDEDERLVLLCDPTQPSPWDLRALAEEQIQLLDVPISPFSPRQQWAISHLLRRLGADIYHSPYYLMPYWPSVPTVLTVYDLIPLRYPQYVSVQVRLLFRWAMALALQVSTRVLVISQATLHDLSAIYRISPERVTVVPPAADPALCSCSPAKVETVRRRYGLPEGYVLYLGSNKPHKNLVRLVEAWAQLQPQPMPLVIAGVWDPRYPEPRHRARALGLGESVFWLGPALEPDLPALYTGATTFVFPSLYEGFGLPVIEAMACGTPVACANTSSLPEVAGDAALLFDPTTVESIADALCHLLDDADLRTDLRERGLRQASQFSWERTAEATLKLYREIVT